MKKKKEAWNDNIVGKRIKARREQLDLTQTELAEKAGCTPACISQYESGIRFPSNASVVRLTKALKTSCEYIAGRENDAVRAFLADDDMLKMMKGFLKLNEENQKLFQNYFTYLQNREHKSIRRVRRK